VIDTRFGSLSSEPEDGLGDRRYRTRIDDHCNWLRSWVARKGELAIPKSAPFRASDERGRFFDDEVSATDPNWHVSPIRGTPIDNLPTNIYSSQGGTDFDRIWLGVERGTNPHRAAVRSFNAVTR
jgi:hypothetical protein